MTFPIFLNRKVSWYFTIIALLFLIHISQTVGRNSEETFEQDNSKENNDDDDEDDGIDLGTGAIIGIVLGSIALLIAIPIIFCFCCGFCCFSEKKNGKIIGVSTSRRASLELRSRNEARAQEHQIPSIRKPSDSGSGNLDEKRSYRESNASEVSAATNATAPAYSIYPLEMERRESDNFYYLGPPPPYPFPGNSLVQDSPQTSSEVNIDDEIELRKTQQAGSSKEKY